MAKERKQKHGSPLNSTFETVFLHFDVQYYSTAVGPQKEKNQTAFLCFVKDRKAERVNSKLYAEIQPMLTVQISRRRHNLKRLLTLTTNLISSIAIALHLQAKLVNCNSLRFNSHSVSLKKTPNPNPKLQALKLVNHQVESLDLSNQMKISIRLKNEWYEA